MRLGSKIQVQEGATGCWLLLLLLLSRCSLLLLSYNALLCRNVGDWRQCVQGPVGEVRSPGARVRS